MKKLKFDAEELIKIAISIEKEGAVFYKNASENCQQLSFSHTLNELAYMELDHEKYFSSLLKDLSVKNNDTIAISPDEQAYQIAKTLTKTFFKFNSDKDHSLKEILDKALKIEQCSIDFYDSLRKVFPEMKNGTDIDLIIKEEQKHLEIIRQGMTNYL